MEQQYKASKYVQSTIVPYARSSIPSLIITCSLLVEVALDGNLQWLMNLIYEHKRMVFVSCV